MRRFLCVTALLLSACDDEPHRVICRTADGTIAICVPGDGGPPVDTCNPLTQAGCAAGEKCTWLLDALMPAYVGHIGCVPDGTATVGDTCMYGAPGASGYDNCQKGLVCGNYRGGAGECKAICDQQGGSPNCGTTHVCVTYSGLFSTGDTTPPAGGVCDLACDPFADNDFDGSAASANSTKTGTTCGSAGTLSVGAPAADRAPHQVLGNGLHCPGSMLWVPTTGEDTPGLGD